MASRALADAGRAAANGKAAKALIQSRRLFFMDSFQPGTDCPHCFLAQRAFERRHIDAAIADGALADALQEDLITFVARREIAQIRSDTTGNGTQTVATRTDLVECGITDADGRLVLAVWVAGQEIGTEVFQARGVNSLWHNVAVCKDLGSGDADGESGDDGAEGAGNVFHNVSLFRFGLLLLWPYFCKPCAS